MLSLFYTDLILLRSLRAGGLSLLTNRTRIVESLFPFRISFYIAPYICVSVPLNGFEDETKDVSLKQRNKEIELRNMEGNLEGTKKGGDGTGAGGNHGDGATGTPASGK